jgi:hypothetical protein
VLFVALHASGCSRLTSAERRLSARLQSAFGISLPCFLAWCGSYLDGGTVGGLVVDRGADSLKWACGRVSRPLKIPKSIRYDQVRLDAWIDSVHKDPPTLAYVGADHFTRPGARPLSVGSSAESLFIQLLWYVAGEDTVLARDMSNHKRFLASRIAWSLERQRAGLTPLPVPR